tara:strand:+ start:474 stop:680 length:207 start_codon:yes stop_codon:yes gene_type:complete
MKKSNSEILNKVRNLVNEKKIKVKNDLNSGKKEEVDLLDNEIKKWIDKHAEKIAKDIIQYEVRKIFKK